MKIQTYNHLLQLKLNYLLLVLHNSQVLVLQDNSTTWCKSKTKLKLQHNLNLKHKLDLEDNHYNNKLCQVSNRCSHSSLKLNKWPKCHLLTECLLNQTSLAYSNNLNHLDNNHPNNMVDNKWCRWCLQLKTNSCKCHNGNKCIRCNRCNNSSKCNKCKHSNMLLNNTLHNKQCWLPNKLLSHLKMLKMNSSYNRNKMSINLFQTRLLPLSKKDKRNHRRNKQRNKKQSYKHPQWWITINIHNKWCQWWTCQISSCNNIQCIHNNKWTWAGECNQLNSCNNHRLLLKWTKSQVTQYILEWCIGIKIHILSQVHWEEKIMDNSRVKIKCTKIQLHQIQLTLCHITHKIRSQLKTTMFRQKVIYMFQNQWVLLDYDKYKKKRNYLRRKN